jgi:hypothetical protein
LLVSLIHRESTGWQVSVCEGQFIKYMEHFYPFLERGLKNFQEYDVCTMTVEILGDLARFIGAQIPINMWERIVWQLLEVSVINDAQCLPPVRASWAWLTGVSDIGMWLTHGTRRGAMAYFRRTWAAMRCTAA